jgi:hypothetical protein
VRAATPYSIYEIIYVKNYINSKCTLEKMNNAISNPTFAAVASIAIILGIVSISGVMKNPQRIKDAVELIQSKVQIGSVMNVDYSFE